MINRVEKQQTIAIKRLGFGVRSTWVPAAYVWANYLTFVGLKEPYSRPSNLQTDLKTQNVFVIQLGYLIHNNKMP